MQHKRKGKEIKNIVKRNLIRKKRHASFFPLYKHNFLLTTFSVFALSLFYRYSKSLLTFEHVENSESFATCDVIDFV